MTLQTTNNQLHEDIGSIKTKIEALTLLVAKMDLQAAEHRKETSQMYEQVKQHKEQLDNAGPIISDIKKWKERTIGAVFMVSALAGTLSIFAVDIFNVIRTKLGF